MVLRSLKEDAEEFLQRPIKDVVISVPAHCTFK
ncbi:Hsp70 family protein [Escherichia coli]